MSSVKSECHIQKSKQLQTQVSQIIVCTIIFSLFNNQYTIKFVERRLLSGTALGCTLCLCGAACT